MDAVGEDGLAVAWTVNPVVARLDQPTSAELVERARRIRPVPAPLRRAVDGRAGPGLACQAHPFGDTDVGRALAGAVQAAAAVSRQVSLTSGQYHARIYEVSTFLGIVLGVATGVAASVIFWFLQFRVFRTKIRVSPTIARYSYQRGGTRCQVKIRNASRRDVIELSVTMRAVMPGLTRRGSPAVLTLGEWTRPLLRGEDEVQYLVRPESMSDDERSRHARFLPSSIVDAIAAREPVDLIDFLKLADGSYIEVFAFGTDALSGARGFAIAQYGINAVVPGEFLSGTFRQTGHFIAGSVSEERQAPASEFGSTLPSDG